MKVVWLVAQMVLMMDYQLVEMMDWKLEFEKVVLKADW